MNDDRTLDLCFALREVGYIPNEVVNVPTLGPVELISYPYPEIGGIGILARTTPGDPGTMRAFRIPPEAADVVLRRRSAQ